jgi:hypothetical protein
MRVQLVEVEEISEEGALLVPEEANDTHMLLAVGTLTPFCLKKRMIIHFYNWPILRLSMHFCTL